MLNHIKLHKGLDIPMKGSAALKMGQEPAPGVIVMKPTDFRALTPKLLVKEGDIVKAGTPVFIDKFKPEVCFTSPCSGTVESIVRGEKRKLLEIRIRQDEAIDYIQFERVKPASLNREGVVNALLESGLWPSIIQRPYGIVANPADEPRAIFVSAFDSAPLAPEYEFTLKEDVDYIQAGVDAISHLTKGKIYFCVKGAYTASSIFAKVSGVELISVEGAHPAGNVGVQINNIAPIGKGEVVWTINPYFLAAIGKLFVNGVYDVSRIIAVAGDQATDPCYIKVLPGVCVESLGAAFKMGGSVFGQDVATRVVSGNALTGKSVGTEGSLGFYDFQFTALLEGDYYESFGWCKPFRPSKFSIQRSYFSWLTPKKKYAMDTNLNGGERAFVVTGLYEKVVPMDIYPVYLIKAILAGDIDKMEQLGIYEVVEEDLALCEYICPSKVNVQQIVAKGIETMIKEMA